jgi:hypothetical protein
MYKKKIETGVIIIEFSLFSKSITTIDNIIYRIPPILKVKIGSSEIIEDNIIATKTILWSLSDCFWNFFNFLSD